MITNQRSAMSISHDGRRILMSDKLCPMRKSTVQSPSRTDESYFTEENFLPCLGAECAIYDNGCTLKHISYIANSLEFILEAINTGRGLSPAPYSAWRQG